MRKLRESEENGFGKDHNLAVYEAELVPAAQLKLYARHAQEAGRGGKR